MKRLLFTGFILSVLFANGQPGNTPGIVVNNSGDTIKGEINYREWTKNPETIDFKHSNGTNETFDPATIKSFLIIKTKELYESFSVDIDMVPANSQTVVASQMSTPVTDRKKVFLLQLLNSTDLRLYFYLDNNKTHFFISTVKGEATELINRYIFVPQREILHHDEAYKQQLQTLFADCPAVAQKTRDLPYLENPIKRLVVKYIKCANPDSYKDENRERGLYVRFGVMIGGMYNFFKFTGTETKGLSSGEYKSSVSPLIGAVVDIGFRINNNKWFIVNELIYKQYKTSHSFFTHTVLYDYTTTNEFVFPYLQLNTLLRYRFPGAGVVRPYINGGMGNGFRFAETKNDKTVVYTDGRPTNKGEAIDGPDKYERSLILGLGVDVKRLQFEARYAFGSGFSPYVNTKSKVYSPQVVLTYKF